MAPKHTNRNYLFDTTKAISEAEGKGHPDKYMDLALERINADGATNRHDEDFKRSKIQEAKARYEKLRDSVRRDNNGADPLDIIDQLMERAQLIEVEQDDTSMWDYDLS